MRKVAAELGCGTMPLYRHVRNKDELLDVMIDAGIGESTGLPATPSGNWREDLPASAYGLRAGIMRHPWEVRVIGRRSTLGPNMLTITQVPLPPLDWLVPSIYPNLWTIGATHLFC